MPPNDATIYNYKQTGTPILESGFWNSNNQFIDNRKILGHSGNAEYCLLYGDIIDCLGFSRFEISNNYISSQTAIPFFQASFNNENLYKGINSTSYSSSGDIQIKTTTTTFYGIYNFSGFSHGIFYPNYNFYYSDVNLNNYSNYLSDGILNIKAYFGYYIPVYQTSGVCPLFGNCNTNPSSVLDMISDAKAGNYAYQYIENYLYFAPSTSAITFSFPNYLLLTMEINKTYSGKSITTYSNVTYKDYNYNTNGLNRILLQNQSSVIERSPNYQTIVLDPSIPTSGSQANIFAFLLNH